MSCYLSSFASCQSLLTCKHTSKATAHVHLVYIVFIPSTVLACLQGAAVASSEGNDEFHRLRQSLIMLGFSEQIQMWYVYMYMVCVHVVCIHVCMCTCSMCTEICGTLYVLFVWSLDCTCTVCTSMSRIALSTSNVAWLQCVYFHVHVHEQSLQEMLRKARQQQHNRKAKQHNTTRPKQSFFKEKLATLGGTRTHDHQLSRHTMYMYMYSVEHSSYLPDITCDCNTCTCMYMYVHCMLLVHYNPHTCTCTYMV